MYWRIGMYAQICVCICMCMSTGICLCCCTCLSWIDLLACLYMCKSMGCIMLYCSRVRLRTYMYGWSMLDFWPCGVADGPCWRRTVPKVKVAKDVAAAQANRGCSSTTGWRFQTFFFSLVLPNGWLVGKHIFSEWGWFNHQPGNSRNGMKWNHDIAGWLMDWLVGCFGRLVGRKFFFKARSE